jgi:hypothetical protein
MAYRSKPLHFLSPTPSTPAVEEAMNSFYTLWLPKHELPKGFPLYHYTTLGGMQGILRDRAIWCGHASMLNDPLEIQYGQKIVADVLNEAMLTQDRHDIREFYKTLLVYVQAFGDNQLLHSFIACFCESGNSLSQWRSYADRGGGYCLGFEFSSTTRIASDPADLGQGKPLILRKVIYEDKEQRELAHLYLNSVVEAAKNALDGELPEMFDSRGFSSVMALQAVNVLLEMLLTFKHPAFKEENEWRLVRVTHENDQPESVHFRESAGQLIPYRPTYIFNAEEHHPTVFPLHSINYGPSLEAIRTRSAIQLFLHHTAADTKPIKLEPHGVRIKGPGYSLR